MVSLFLKFLNLTVVFEESHRSWMETEIQTISTKKSPSVVRSVSFINSKTATEHKLQSQIPHIYKTVSILSLIPSEEENSTSYNFT